MLNAFSIDKTHTNFGLTRSMVKVTMATCKKCQHGFRLLSLEMFITELSDFTTIGLGEDTSPNVFMFTRSMVKTTWATFVISYVNSF